MKLNTKNSLFQIPNAEKYLTTFLPRLQEKRVQSFTTLTLTLVTLSFFGIFAISPTLSTIADLQKQISDDQFVTQRLKQKIVNLTQLQLTYKNMQPDLPILFSAVPVNPDVTVLVGQLQTVAQNSSVTLVSVQTLAVDVSNLSPTGYNAFAFTLSVSGSFDSIKTFLHNLTNFNRLLSINALSVTQSTLNNSYTLSLRGNAYFKTQQ